MYVDVTAFFKKLSINDGSVLLLPIQKAILYMTIECTYILQFWNSKRVHTDILMQFSLKTV